MIQLVFLFILASFVFRYYNHVMLHQLLQPVIVKTESDLAYWLYHITGISKWIVQHPAGSLIFDCVLVGLCVACIIFPTKRFLVIAFSLLYPLYFISYNAFVTHHTGTMNGILLITFAFWATKPVNFQLLWEALRYYTLAIYVMAFSWKLFVGVSVFNITQPEAILKDNLALYLYLNPGTIMAQALQWFLQHPFILYLGYSCCILIQGCMVIGFFTKRYDRILGILPLFFHLATYFFVDVCYFELLILNVTFIKAGTLNRCIEWIPAFGPGLPKANQQV